MFCDLLFLQFGAILILVFYFVFWDNFFIIINSLVFLLICASIAWLLEADIYVSFLVIIDLGVFFVLTSFLINFISIFNTKRLAVYGGFWVCLVFILILLTRLISFNAEPSVLALLPSFYDWYSLFNFTYFADLQFLSELYYTFFSFEFLLMNFYLYLVIFGLYLLNYKMTILKSRLEYRGFYTSPVIVRGNFFRVQDVQTQLSQRASVRTWSKA